MIIQKYIGGGKQFEKYFYKQEFSASFWVEDSFNL